MLKQLSYRPSCSHHFLTQVFSVKAGVIFSMTASKAPQVGIFRGIRESLVYRVINKSIFGESGSVRPCSKNTASLQVHIRISNLLMKNLLLQRWKKTKKEAIEKVQLTYLYLTDAIIQTFFVNQRKCFTCEPKSVDLRLRFLTRYTFLKTAPSFNT